MFRVRCFWTICSRNDGVTLLFCQEQIYIRLTDGRLKLPVFAFGQTVCLPQTHHPFTPNASSVSFKRIIRFPQTYYPFVFPFFMLLPLHFLFLSAPLPFFFGLSGRYTIVYLIFLLFILCPLVGCWAGCWTDSSC